MWLAVLACLPLAAQIEGPAPDPLEQGYRSLREGDAGGAVDWFRQAAEGQPAASVAWRELGYAYLRIGEDGSAQQVFEQVLADEPTDARTALEYEIVHVKTVAGRRAHDSDLQILGNLREVRQRTAQRRESTFAHPFPVGSCFDGIPGVAVPLIRSPQFGLDVSRQHRRHWLA